MFFFVIKYFCSIDLSVEVLEFMILERGMTVKFLRDHRETGDRDILELIYKLEGIEGIKKINLKKAYLRLNSYLFLKSIGIKLDFLKTCKSVHEDDVYALVCFKVMKYKDLRKKTQENFMHYVENIVEYEIKACKHLFPFMKEIRKEKDNDSVTMYEEDTFELSFAK